jgi:hypothetical protein
MTVLSRGCVVGIELCYVLDDPGFEFRQGQAIYLFPNAQTGSGEYPDSYLMGTGLKRLGLKAVHSLQWRDEVRN